MKKPKNIPTEIGQRVKLRGRLHTGEVTCILPIFEKYPTHSQWVNVAWDWECYIQEDSKYPVWGWLTVDELEVILDDKK